MLYTKEMWNALFAEAKGNARLNEMAEIAMEAPLYTVTNKMHALPKGGVPNDYVSIGPYWWPDPEKEDGLPWIRRDGEINPVFYEYDSKTIFDFTTDAGLLMLAGLANGRKDYLDRAVEQLESWFINPKTRMNPHMRFGQFVPGRAEGRCFGIIDGKELYWLFELMELMPFNDTWTPGKLNAIKVWAAQLLNWLLTDELGITEGNTLNNHAISYDCMVAMFALFIGDEAFARKHLQERSIPRIAQQYAADGSLPLELDRTDSKGYSTFTELCFLQAAVLGKKLGVAFPDEMLRKGLTWLEGHIYSPDWKWVQIVPYKRISPMVYQFAGMFWDEQQLLDKAKRECADEPWKKMIVFRSVRYKTVQG